MGRLTKCLAYAALLLSLATISIYCQPDQPIFTANDEVDASDLACAACLAVVDIVDKHMSKKSFDGVESRLYDSMEKICDQSNFRAYDFIPPKMAQACRTFIDKADDEELVSIFERYYSTKSPVDRNILERKVCLSFSGECVGNRRMDDRKPPAKSLDTEKLDKQFDASIDDIMSEHGHKIKQPKPVKLNDEL